VVKRITDALVAGNTRKASAAYAGVTPRTFERWMCRYVGFVAAVAKAEAQAEVSHVANIAQAARDGTWTASVWWIERRRSSDWGKVDRVEIELRRAAERIAESYPAESRPDPEWLIWRAQEIAQAPAGLTGGASRAEG
jgi:hypothetical protein